MSGSPVSMFGMGYVEFESESGFYTAVTTGLNHSTDSTDSSKLRSSISMRSFAHLDLSVLVRSLHSL